MGDGDDVASACRRSPDRDDAIAGLFYALYPQLVRTVFGLSGDREVAEELAQEAFLRLWRRWRWIRDPVAAPAYLNRTVVNLAYTAGRRRGLEIRLARLIGPGPDRSEP